MVTGLQCRRDMAKFAWKGQPQLKTHPKGYKLLHKKIREKIKSTIQKNYDPEVHLSLDIQSDC